VIGASVDDADRVVAIAVARDGKNGHAGGPLVGAQATAELDAVQAWTGDIGKNQIGSSGKRFFKSLKAVVGLIRSKPIISEHLGIELSCLGIVLDNQDEGRSALVALTDVELSSHSAR